MKNAILPLIRLVAGHILLLPSLHAAVITFNAGTATVSPGGNVSVPITVSSSVTPPSTFWGNAGFYLVWNDTVLTLQATPVDLTGTPLPITTANFNNPNSGELRFSWFSGTGVEVANGSTLFTVQFTANGAPGSSTALSFTMLNQIGLTDSSGNNLVFTTPAGVNGQIDVVPEPVNVALGLFAIVFLGAASARWMANHRRKLCA